MMFTITDVEVEEGGTWHNVSFARRVSEDGADLGVSHVIEHTHEHGPVLIHDEDPLVAQCEAWCQAHPMPREDVQGPGPWEDC